MPAGVVVDDELVETYFAPDWVKSYRRSAAEPLTTNQRLVFVLLSDTIQEHRSSNHDDALSALVVWGLIGPAMAGIGFLLLMALYYSSHWLLGSGTDWVLYPSVGLVVAAVLAIRKDHQQMTVDFTYDNDANIRGLNLGRLHNIFERDQVPMTMLAYLAGLIGVQAGLLHYTSDHLSVGGYEDGYDGFGIAFDNLFRGIFLDVFDIYGLYVNRPVEYTTFSATVFLIFRTSMNLLFVYSIYVLFQWFRMRGIFRGLPTSRVTSAQLTGWMNRVRRENNRWSRWYFDEFVFFLVCERFLSGNYEHVRQLTRRFPRLRVDDRIRRLFVDDSGQLLFEGYRQ